MAVLCPGVQYGLSSQGKFGENKDLVFVKLTDSAYRAIEEYLRLQKQKHISRTPTIKFLGNEGQLSFPSSSATGPDGGSASPAPSNTMFSFSLSSTADMEGPGGSFECVQQCQAVGGAGAHHSVGTLASLGTIAHKMRVHATDDVYEETRKRMTFADRVQKNKCTREIKPNQTDIGRKVKVKQLQHHHHHHQQTAANQSASIGRNSGATISTSCTATANSVASTLPLKHHHHHHQQTGAPPLHSSSLTPNSLNTVSGTNSYNGLLDRIGGGGSSANTAPQRFNGQGLRSNHVSSSKSTIKQSMSSLARRPLRERLIQLLALRPFKKIEILERLNKEGLRERNGISSVLKQVATSKDNCYYLNRVMWNDVQEEWPFYTEQEKQLLKRQKPQNLTPPGGSDGGSSTGSGNSPTSTHPGSPPTTMSTSGRHRVSHLSANLQQRDKERDGGGVVGVGGGYRPIVAPVAVDSVARRQQTLPVDRRHASGMNPRSRQLGVGGVGGISGKRHLSDDDDGDDDDECGEDGVARKRQCDSHTLSFGVHRHPDTPTLPPPQRTSPKPPVDPLRDNSTPPSAHHHHQQQPSRTLTPKPPTTPQQSDGSQQRPINWNWNCAQQQQQGKETVVRVSADSQSDGATVGGEYDDYVREYARIGDLEQRRRYKSDFNAVYDEYKELHGVVEAVSRRFQLLDERLKGEPASNTPKYNEIKEQIMREYKQTKNNQQHQNAKRRFEYLHRKLSHIKDLVTQYDLHIQQQDHQQSTTTNSY